MNTQQGPRHLARVLGFSLVLFLAACASTPQSRIEKYPDEFSRLPAEQQELVKQGKVAIGFDETAVKLALGEPDRISEREDAQGRSTVWRYTQWETDYGAPLYTGYYHRYYSPFWPYRSPYYFMDEPARREVDAIRVSFRGGKVESVEREVR